jgi:Domain of unknown function (DUF4160)
MAQVRAFQVPGIRLLIPSGDHQPPHIHASKRGGDWAAKVYINAGRGQMIELIRPPGARIGSGDRSAIEDGVINHRAELLLEWENCQAG